MPYYSIRTFDKAHFISNPELERLAPPVEKQFRRGSICSLHPLTFHEALKESVSQAAIGQLTGYDEAVGEDFGP
jgi:hypothetical protein